MKRVLGLGLLFLVVLLGALAATLPLGFVLEQADLRRAGLVWDSAQGTIWKGQVTGLSYAGQTIGTVSLTAHPAGLIAAKLSYDVELSGPAGEGKGHVQLRRKRYEIKNFNGVLRAGQLIYLAPDLRQTDGEVRFEAVKLDVRQGDCQAASGRITSNVLMRLADQLGGLVGGQMTGEVTCEGPMLVARMEGSLEGSDQVRASARLGVREPSELEVRIGASDPLLAQGLLAYDFSPEAEGFVYRKTVNGFERLGSGT